MKIESYTKVVGLSLVTAMLLGSSAYAGKIVTDADLSNIVVTPNMQFGFGGWNLENVDVRMTDIDYADNGKTFNADGTYDLMESGDSFESNIKSDTGTLMGHLHGKDWPVGEPSGIKIINGDTKMKHGKPENCIMTSSYLVYQDMDNNESGSGYLDTTDARGPQPVICSSPFQTHKRFKINMLPVTVADVDDITGGYGKSIDLVFNLEADDTSVQRYQVLQKINNYTDKRLDGYKMEVLDANGVPNAALTLSLGVDEGVDKNGTLDGSDIWGTEDMANMSHGLWGPIDSNFDVPGFFDNLRAYYPVTLAATNTIEYNGVMQGGSGIGNYQSLFGNWLPSIWEPQAIFFDDDNNPETDAMLMAFWGDPLKTGTNAWHKGNEDNWAEPSDTEFLQWSTNAAYSVGGVEDVLNLGVNYIINVGDNAQIGSTFILRVTPHIGANDQTPPSYMVDIPEPPVISDGTVAISPAPTFIIGTRLTLSVKDEDQNFDPTVPDNTTVIVTTDNGDKETVTLTEDDINSSVFTANIPSELATISPVVEDGIVSVIIDSNVTVTYQDNIHLDTASTIATVLVAPTAYAGPDQTVQVNEIVTITGTGTDTDGTIISYEWKYGATVVATTASFEFTPRTVGTATLTLTVTDNDYLKGTDSMNLTVTESDVPTDPTDPTEPTEPPAADNPIIPISTGGGGGCTYNPNSKNFDMTFLLMMALGLLYPFRRRFLK